jgi:hypothetical protein
MKRAAINAASLILGDGAIMIYFNTMSLKSHV